MKEITTRLWGAQLRSGDVCPRGTKGVTKSKEGGKKIKSKKSHAIPGENVWK